MTALQKIQLEAKKIRKARPSIAYKDAIKQASVKYNAGKLGAAAKPITKKKNVTKLHVKKIVTTVTKEKIGNTGNSVLRRFNDLIKEIEIEQKSIAILKERQKKYPDKKVFYKAQIISKQKYIANLKLQKNSLKKLL